ncbi:MAG: hypothetical protein IVW52_19180 [Acidimicrobiales bacterium]|nr:hypothetical protein [Acidimicrobiales bacterium]
MSRIALIARFDGDAQVLEESFRAAATKYSQDLAAPQPTSALLMRNKEGIVVVMTWPEGSGIKPFQAFFRGSLEELGLPHPRVEHFRADAITWGALSKE